jgi:hypothetical protein
MKMTVFWDVRVMSALMMEAVSTSETSVSFDGTTRRNIPEDCHLQTRFYRTLEPLCCPVQVDALRLADRPSKVSCKNI